MDSLKIKIKINNSYESDPSSGSGSLLSEHGAVSDDENMHLPYLLKPPSYQNEVTIVTTQYEDYSRSPSTIATIMEEVEKERDLRYGIPVSSSQESSFEGFKEDSPFGKLKQRIYEYNPTTEAINNKQQQQQSLSIKKPNEEISPGKIVFANFYDSIVDENSCNAVDMLLTLSNEPAAGGSQTCDSDINPSSELSFNGKIKRLTNSSSHMLQDQMASTIQQQQPLTVAAQRLPTLLEVERPLNNSQLNESSFILKRYTNERSPDLFGDDDDDDDDDPEELHELVIYEEEVSGEHDLSTSKSLNCPTESSFADDQTLDYTQTQLGISADQAQSLFRANCRRDKELLRRIRKCLAGVPPPPAFTIPQLDVITTVLKRKEDIFNFNKQVLDLETITVTSAESCSTLSSLFKPTHTLAETKIMPWKDILSVRQHGLSFNLNKASESNEYLSLSVVERFVGAETASSYQNSPSSAKKRNSRLKMLTQSPGNRLSHLAKRRAVFSSANLANTSLKSTSSLGTQILLDKKKTKHRRKGTPRRKTPGSKKKNARKTPTSSARKRLYRCDLIKPGPSRETSKRALFQSPAKTLQQKYALPKPIIKPEIATRVEKSKRALFSPDKLSQSSMFSDSNAQQYTSSSCSLSYGGSSQLESLLLKRKRHTADDDDDCDAAEFAAQSSKVFRGSEHSLTPRALKIKSQSFCIGAGSSSNCYNETRACATATLTSSRHFGLSNSQLLQNSSSSSNSLLAPNAKLLRTHSEMTATASNSLTENQRKKLLWAVSQALQEKKITAKHGSFKQYASVLARVVRRIFQEYYQKNSTSNSETMLRLAKKYVYNVITGKNVDDIYFNAKTLMDENKHKSSNRLSGYIAPEEYHSRKNSQQLSQTNLGSQKSIHGSMNNIFGTDSSMDSFGMISISQVSSVLVPSTTQTSIFERMSQDQPLISSTIDSISLLQNQNTQQSQKLTIQPNSTLQNSSSKNNLCGLALRENVDCEQRRSAQKNFTGKDQRNVSPHAGATTTHLGSGVKVTSAYIIQDLHAATTAKAKRQILFDS